ncbi:MarR family transcriptional regulator [Bacillus sp. M6-12]|uniref:MarR family winged helix-turn-helix transcriptional regulator n=1 Tax=Bacillus sp. M6-12 TaxID=2054166 RepID=UPI000C75F662|nr:MarR family winged helix-turn-helix transcriptional regulator [Bacillus sp. M6-12]PLS18230.1 MarR family transcriptional regulator [Bacillus sp. M6-12]
METENLRGLFQLLTRRFGLLNKNCCSTEQIEVSLVQSHILYEIHRQHKPSIQQIAETLGTDITTFSRQVQTLIKMNLVKKTPDAEDRRISILSLTEDGIKINNTIEQQMNDYLNEIFSTMNEFEKETVVRSLKLLNDRMVKSSVCCTTPWG